uniref:Rhotekin 2a n=1 Tax=Echeneis naucrates TaxID=173247 RepID=A0A665WUD2_ECHNA
MEDPRDVQTSRRNDSSDTTLSSGSAVAMEIKRKKIRQSALFLQTENTNLQEKLNFEMRMREGAYKLLLACSKREQVLNTSKNLLTCNARIKAYLTELQKKTQEHDTIGATFLLLFADVGLRIPLMFVSIAMFCLMQLGAEVFDTEMVVVDRSVTDVFPQFELKVELWSCALEEELTLVNTPKKFAKRLRNSFGKTGGKKLCHLLDNPDPDTFLQHNPIPSYVFGAKYSLLAYTTLCLPEFNVDLLSLLLLLNLPAEWSSWLPLYGNLCCRLVAQPACMTQSMMRGYLSQKGMNHCCSLYCVLSAGFLSCYFTPEEIDAKVQPMCNIAINKDTRIRVIEKDSAGHKSRSMSIINPSPEGSQTVVFTTDSRDELEDWLDALHQHLYDQSQWLQCCNQLMKIEVTSPRKPSLFLTKQPDSVYNDLSELNNLTDITDIIHNKIEETDGHFLIGHEEEKEAPNWSSLFEGSHSVVVQKTILSQSKTSTPCSSPNPNNSSTPISNKKRRAPPPPPDREPYAPPAHPTRPPLPRPLHHPLPLPCQEKENSSSGTSHPTTRSKTGRPSLDAKFSAIIQQLQRNNTGGAGAHSRKNAPLGVLDIQPQVQSQTPLQQQGQASETTAELGFVRPSHGPVPAPRSKVRKSFRERMNLKAL